MKKYIFFVAVFLSGVANASFERLGVSVESGQLYFEISVDKQFDGKSLDIRLTNNSTPVDLLSSYYYYGMKNDLKAIRGVHFSGDGTLMDLDQELVEIPDKFEGFKNLTQITLGNIYAWENYYAVDVVWHTKNDGDIKWTDLVVCQGGCFISNRFYVVSDKFEFFSNVLRLIKKYPHAKSKYESLGDLCIEVKNCNNPIKIGAAFKKINTNNDIADLNIFGKSFQKYSLLSKIVFEFKNNKTDYKSSADRDAYIKEFIKCCWRGFRNNDEIKLFDVNLLQASRRVYKSSYFSPFKLFDLFNELESMHLLGVVSTDGVDYVFARTKLSGFDTPILQMYMLSGTAGKSDWMLVSASTNKALSGFLEYAGVAEYIENYLNAAK